MKWITTTVLLVALAAAPSAALAGRPPVVYRQHWSLPAHSNGAVKLDLHNQNVRMRVRSGETVGITAIIRGDPDQKQQLVDRYMPIVRAVGADVIISAQDRDDHPWLSFDGRPQALVEVALPPGMKVHFSVWSGNFSFDGGSDRAPLEGTVDNGNIFVRSASRELDLGVDSGNVRATLSQPAQRVALKADSGNVRFEGGAKWLKIHTDAGNIIALGKTGSADLTADAGSIRIMSLSGSLSAELDSGDVTAEWRRLADDSEIEVEADSGNVTLTLPEDAQLSGVIETGGGTIDSDFVGDCNEDRDRLTLRASAGAIPVHIEVEHGDVTLRKRE